MKYWRIRIIVKFAVILVIYTKQNLECGRQTIEYKCPFYLCGAHRRRYSASRLNGRMWSAHIYIEDDILLNMTHPWYKQAQPPWQIQLLLFLVYAWWNLISRQNYCYSVAFNNVISANMVCTAMLHHSSHVCKWPNLLQHPCYLAMQTDAALCLTDRKKVHQIHWKVLPNGEKRLNYFVLNMSNTTD